MRITKCLGIAITGVAWLLSGCSTKLNPAADLMKSEKAANGRATFLVEGALESCDAKKVDPRFRQLVDDQYYLTKNADVRQAVMAGVIPDATTHFLCYGQFEGRKPNLLYSESYYLQSNQDVAVLVRAGVYPTAFFHFAKYGQFEGRKTFPPIPRWTTPADAPLVFAYNEGFYRAENPEVDVEINAGRYVSGIAHYIAVGQIIGLKPSAQWDETRYRQLNPDVFDGVVTRRLRSGLEHYLEAGRNESGRLPMPEEPGNPSSTPNTGLPAKRLVAENGDLIEVLRSQTSSGFVEVNVYAKDNMNGGIYRHLITPALLIPYAVCDWQMRRNDLACVLPIGAQSGMVEIHALSYESSYREANVHAATAIRLDDAPNMDFRFAGGDFVAIKRRNAQSGMVEVHIMSEASDFRTFIRHDVSALRLDDAPNFRFGMVGNTLAVLKVTNAQTETVEVHWLTYESGYRIFTIQTGSAIPQALASDLDLMFSPVTGDLLSIVSEVDPGTPLFVDVLRRADIYQRPRR